MHKIRTITQLWQSKHFLRAAYHMKVYCVVLVFHSPRTPASSFGGGMKLTSLISCRM